MPVHKTSSLRRRPVSKPTRRSLHLCKASPRTSPPFFILACLVGNSWIIIMSALGFSTTVLVICGFLSRLRSVVILRLFFHQWDQAKDYLFFHKTKAREAKFRLSSVASLQSSERAGNCDHMPYLYFGTLRHQTAEGQSGGIRFRRHTFDGQVLETTYRSTIRVWAWRRILVLVPKRRNKFISQIYNYTKFTFQSQTLETVDTCTASCHHSLASI